MEMDIPSFNKLVVHPSFNKTISEINKLNINLPLIPTPENMDFSFLNYPVDGKLVTNVEKIGAYRLNEKHGEVLASKDTLISAYDESINKFASLEGVAYLTSHSLILHQSDDYIPSAFLTFYFYTRSRVYTELSNYIKYSDDIESDSKIDYVIDRNKFIVDNTPRNSIIFIDGPLIGGQMSNYTFNLNEQLLNKNVIPIFFVKNSTSNLVTDNIKEIKGKFNSDMHWAFNTLKQGERTNLYQYEDVYNKNNSKMFCYLKNFNVSPQRVEFHTKTFDKYKGVILDIMDLIYYLSLVQGDLRNPQIRSIAIAEKYARETISLINLNSLMKNLGIVSTINQERFGWG